MELLIRIKADGEADTLFREWRQLAAGADPLPHYATIIKKLIEHPEWGSVEEKQRST